VPAAIGAIARGYGAKSLVTWTPPPRLAFDAAPALAREGCWTCRGPRGQEDEAARLRHREQAARAQLGVTGADSCSRGPGR